MFNNMSELDASFMQVQVTTSGAEKIFKHGIESTWKYF